MKGDIVVVQERHKQAARKIVPQLMNPVRGKGTRYIITVAGESGSGKSELARALANEFTQHAIGCVVLGQDDYFVLPPRSNDLARREDADWLGPHVEVRLDLMEQNLVDALEGKGEITKPLIDYDSDTIQEETINLNGISVLVAEGTYTSLLKHVDSRIFILRDWLDTLEDRKKRNRGKELGDPFIEQVLSMEHKIIAGHRHLADFLITKEYEVLTIA